MIHPTAIVSAEAKIHDSVTVGPYTIIDGNTEIGEGTVIDGHVLIRPGARIGKNCHIFHSAVISEMPQDLKFRGENTLTVIGDNTTIREFATLHRATDDRMETRVGSNCLIMAYVHLAHDVWVGDHVIISNASQIAGHADVEDWAIISGMVGLHQFVKVGAHSFIGGGFRAGQDVPPYILASGEPLRYSGLNAVGLKRRGFSSEQLDSLKQFYRTLYRSSMNRGEALRWLEKNFVFTPETTYALNFIKRSSRGLI